MGQHENPQLVLARNGLDADRWRAVCAEIVAAIRDLDLSVLVVIDEAHFVAPQDAKLLEPIKGLATTGRGEQVSVIWVTQRLAELDSTVISQCTAWLLGGFTSDADLNKLKEPLEYAVQAHKVGGQHVPGLPEALHAPDEGAISVRKFTDDADHVVGSEWIYSDDSGTMERKDTSDLQMRSEHVGAQGKRIRMPV